MQRKTIEQLDAYLTTARQDGRWRDAALALNDMSDSDITVRVAPARLSPANRGKLHAAIPERAHKVRGVVEKRLLSASPGLKLFAQMSP